MQVVKRTRLARFNARLKLWRRKILLKELEVLLSGGGFIGLVQWHCRNCLFLFITHLCCICSLVDEHKTSNIIANNTPKTSCQNTSLMKVI